MNKKHTNIWLPKLNYYSKRLSMWQEKFWREVNGKPFMGVLDNIAGRRTFEFATFGRSGVQQSNSKLFRMTKARTPVIPIMQEMTSVSAFPYGTAAAAAQDAAALETQIDRGSQIYDADSMNNWRTYGYAFDTNNWFGVSAFGTMDATTYTDGGSNSRTIRSCHDAEAGGSGGGDWYFSIDTTSVPNTDATWLDITWDDINGTPFTIDRSVDTTYTASLNSDTHWRDLTPGASFDDLDANTDFVLTTS